MPEDLRTLSARDLVEELHPEGEWSARHTVSIATQISELVRCLNNSTQYQQAAPRPVDIGNTLTELGVALQRLPQTLQQLSSRLYRIADDPDLINRENRDAEGAGAQEAIQAAMRLNGEDSQLHGLKEMGKEIERIGFQVHRVYINRDDQYDGDDE